MFKLKSEFSGNEKTSKANEIKTALEALPSLISQIKFYEVGINVISSERAFDMVLISSFENLETLDEYRVHPEHQKVVALIKENSEASTVVDYEI
jgi:hypothetical protein